jgi:hypothetical protein
MEMVGIRLDDAHASHSIKATKSPKAGIASQCLLDHIIFLSGGRPSELDMQLKRNPAVH